MYYFNTVSEVGDTLKEYRSKAKSQDAKILKFFQSYPFGHFSARDIQDRCFPDINTPITSVRRSITNLTNSGHLKKCGKKYDEAYGRDCYTWKLVQIDYKQANLF